MVEKRINVLINFLSKGMAETIAHTNRVHKAMGRLAGPKSITEAIAPTFPAAQAWDILCRISSGSSG